jgi:hypothetical protein
MDSSPLSLSSTISSLTPTSGSGNGYNLRVDPMAAMVDLMATMADLTWYVLLDL